MRTLESIAGRLVERAPLPDSLVRLGIAYRVAQTRRALGSVPIDADVKFAAEMAARRIAVATEAANAQHYELPPEFFALMLGPRRKYSCCLYANEQDTLAAAEEQALAATAEHAALTDGQTILELGCGWGSLSLWMAERFPGSRITAVSNSAAQRASIEREAGHRGLHNLNVVTADMNVFSTTHTFDRVVSVEMFEHMANWRGLLQRIRGWIAPHGRLFLHVFSHRRSPYLFDEGDNEDWIGQHFFSGGLMPSRGLIRQFNDLFTVEQEWCWSGTHYQRTALDWLANFDAGRAEIEPILRTVYGADTPLWMRRWRLFLLATAGLFGDCRGEEWGVSHYRLRVTA